MSGANNKNGSMQIRAPVWSKKYDFLINIKCGVFTTPRPTGQICV